MTGGTTVLLTTQYLDEAERLADHVVVVMEAGKLIAAGTPEQLKARVGGDQLDVVAKHDCDLAAAAATWPA